MNDHILPPGVKIVPFIDRSELVHYTTHTVLHNLTEAFILVVIVLMLSLGNIKGALIVALTIPFSLLFASILLQARHIPAIFSHAIGSDSQRPFAMVIVGGLIVDLIMSTFLLPTFYVWWARPADHLPAAEESRSDV
jgi:cobalt-zinc-cadmium resistance protein CzcA